LGQGITTLGFIPDIGYPTLPYKAKEPEILVLGEILFSPYKNIFKRAFTLTT
jgi:hypothetical protein